MRLSVKLGIFTRLQHLVRGCVQTIFGKINVIMTLRGGGGVWWGGGGGSL